MNASEIVLANMQPGTMYTSNSLAEVTRYAPATVRLALTNLLKAGKVQRKFGAIKTESKFKLGNGKFKTLKLDGWYVAEEPK